MPYSRYRGSRISQSESLTKVYLPSQLLFQGVKAINLAVADHIAAVQLKGLHPFRVQTHDGQTVEAYQPLAGVHDPAVVGTAGDGAVKKSLKFRYSDTAVTEPHNRTHRKILLHKIFSIG